MYIYTQKRKFDRSWKARKVTFHRNYNYDAVKKRCQEVAWPQESNDPQEGETTYYVADGSGLSIECNNFEVVSEDGSKNVIPWTLANYLQISHIKYPSRTRLYCVKMCKGTDV